MEPNLGRPWHIKPNRSFIRWRHIGHNIEINLVRNLRVRSWAVPIHKQTFTRKLMNQLKILGWIRQGRCNRWIGVRYRHPPIIDQFLTHKVISTERLTIRNRKLRLLRRTPSSNNPLRTCCTCLGWITWWSVSNDIISANNVNNGILSIERTPLSLEEPWPRRGLSYQRWNSLGLWRA